MRPNPSGAALPLTCITYFTSTLCLQISHSDSNSLFRGFPSRRNEKKTHTRTGHSGSDWSARSAHDAFCTEQSRLRLPSHPCSVCWWLRGLRAKTGYVYLCMCVCARVWLHECVLFFLLFSPHLPLFCCVRWQCVGCTRQTMLECPFA